MVLFIWCVNVTACSSLEALYNSLPLIRKESKMAVLSRQKGSEAVIVKRTKISLREGAGNKAQRRMSLPAMQNIPSLRRVHEIKVFTVRQQLAEGRYGLDEHLDSAVDRLIETATEQNNTAGCSC
jgi:hypothetical protein